MWGLGGHGSALTTYAPPAASRHRGGDYPDLDALATFAESGFAWTLLYPDYTVVMGLTGFSKWPMGYPIAGRDQDLWVFMNKWIDFKKKDGTIQRAYDHWILGIGS